MHRAARNNDAAMLIELLGKGVPVDLVDANGYTPLLHACIGGSTESVNLLLREGASANHVSKEGDTALMNACAYGHAQLVEPLVQNGASLSAANHRDQSALTLAIAHDWQNCAMELLVQSPLHLACSYGNRERVIELLPHVDIEALDALDTTALISAVKGAQLDCAKVLLEAGADPNNHSPLSYARDVNIAQLLLEHGARVDAVAPWLFHLCANGHVEVVKLMLANNIVVNPPNQCCDTPLMGACMFGNPEIVALLLERGARVDARNNRDQTALHLACAQGHAACVRLLLAHKASVDVTDLDGKTPVTEACAGNHQECVFLLHECASRAARTAGSRAPPIGL